MRIPRKLWTLDLGGFIELVGRVRGAVACYFLPGEGTLNHIGVYRPFLIFARLRGALRSPWLVLPLDSSDLGNLGCPHLVGLELTCRYLGRYNPDTLRS